ncbi:MAG: LptF/LptG family permease, partial [Gemmatimonadaceae bacterium]
TQLQRLFFKVDLVRVRGVGNQFRESQAGAYKGEREMTVCEMERTRRDAQRNYTDAQAEFDEHVRNANTAKIELSREVRDTNRKSPSEWSLSGAYCGLLGAIGGPADTAKRAQAQAGVAPSMGIARPRDVVADERLPPKATRVFPRAPSSAAASVNVTTSPAEAQSMLPAMIEASRIRMIEASRVMNLYSVEIHKKFALAVACVVFVLLGAPIALRFPRGGVGLTIGVSIGVFGLYYVALIGGQSLGNRGIVPPALAMWGANILFGAAGLLLLVKLGTESATSRGGDAREMADAFRSWAAKHLLRAGIRLERRRSMP